MANILENGPIRRALRERQRKQSPQEGELPPLESLTMIEEEERVHFRQLDEIRQTILKKKQER